MRDILFFVALDYNNQQRNLEIARRLAGEVSSSSYGFKVNLDGVVDFSPDALNSYNFIKQIRDLGRPVFVDMKMWNGARTMENVARGCADLGVSIVNMYPHAGKNFVERVKRVLENSDTQLFGLTVLSHYTDADTQSIYGKNLRDTVRMLAEMNCEFGVKGIIVPGTALDSVRDICAPKLVAGIRPDWFGDKAANLQEQTVTPREAVAGGAQYLVVGSPILKSNNSIEALERLLGEIK